MAISFRKILNEGMGYPDAVGDSLGTEAISHFGINVVGKSHEGGWPLFLRVVCTECGAPYMVYAGMSEPSNSVYLVTVQGVAEIEGNAGRG